MKKMEHRGSIKQWRRGISNGFVSDGVGGVDMKKKIIVHWFVKRRNEARLKARNFGLYKARRP